MNDIRKMMIDAATKIMKDLSTKEVINAAEQGQWPEELWTTLEEAGMTIVAVPEEAGGSGGGRGDALSILRVAGKFAAPIPLAETLMANWLLSGAGLPIDAGPLTVAPVSSGEQIQLKRSDNGWILNGTANHVPWARDAKEIVVVGHSEQGLLVARVEPGAVAVQHGQNLAGEPRDTVIFDHVRVADQAVAPAGKDVDEKTLWHWGALTRSVLMAGALERVLELTVTYSKERIQFGRPIGRFQAVQQQLAIMAGEVAAAGVAADFAIDAFDAGTAETEVMMAKSRIGEAAGVCAPIAHQVHGAIGFTDEHALHQTTRRLWSWRDEFGTENDWAERLGEKVMAAGPEALWPAVTAPFGGFNKN